MMTRRFVEVTIALALLVGAAPASLASRQSPAAVESLVSRAEVGRPGGQLVMISARDMGVRKRLRDRVQALVAEHLPIIPPASPHVLVGAIRGLGNFRPTVLDHHALWNVDELSWRGGSSGARR
jgi:hypothetical protein